MFYDRLVALAKEKKKSINQVEIDLGFSKNTLYNTKKYTPQGDKLAKLADYFEVSTDYLLEKTDIKTTKKEPVDLEELTSDDGINWDEWLSFGGQPISEHDKNKIKEIFGDRLKD
ncbi:helix-turn-helix domain-containing protein [Lactococcus lactis]